MSTPTRAPPPSWALRAEMAPFNRARLVTPVIDFTNGRRLVYRASLLALFLSFVAGFLAVVWRERRLPDISLRHLKEITSFLHCEDYSRALDRLRIATTIAPSDETAFHLLGVGLQQVGDLSGAKAAFQQVLKFEPVHVDATSASG